ncbi:MAG: hypothetical protein ACR2NB_06380 [Solirubrobacteraceae bacterium]
MSTTQTACDHCGETIAKGDPHVYINVGTVGSVTRSAFDTPRELDFHASGGRDCFTAHTRQPITVEALTSGGINA